MGDINIPDEERKPISGFHQDQMKSKKNHESKFLSEETQKKIRDITPEVSQEEIFSCNTPQSRVADNFIWYFGQTTAKFENQEDLNLGMRILHMANQIRATGDRIADTPLFTKFIENFEEMPWEEFQRILNVLAGFSPYSFPLQQIPGGYEVTRLGRLLLHSYQKMKADILAQEKYGPLADLFASIQDILSYYSYCQYGLGIDFIYSNANNLKEAIKALRQEGEALILDEEFHNKLDVIGDLVDQMLEIQDLEKEGTGALNFQQYIAITNGIVDAFKEINILRQKRFLLATGSARQVLLDDPFPEIVEFLSLQMVEEEWGEELADCPDGALPINVPMRLSPHYIARALKSFFQDHEIIQPDPLPKEPPREIVEGTASQLRVRETEHHLLQEELLTKAQAIIPCLDYELAKNRNPVRFCENIIALHGLAQTKKFSLLNQINEIDDHPFNVALFHARPIEPNNIIQLESEDHE